MSTRGVIAVQHGHGFKGRYHHFDSYPSGLGRTLYYWANKMPRDKLIKLLIDEHPAGWSTIVGRDLTKEPGYVDLFNVNRECAICGRMIWEHYKQYYGRDGRPPLPKEYEVIDKWLITDHSPEPVKLPDDNRPSCYCHGTRSENIDQVLTEQNAQACGCEYAYVFNDDLSAMTIYSSYCTNGEKMIGMFGCGDENAVWVEIATVKFDEAEQDWDYIDYIATERVTDLSHK